MLKLSHVSVRFGQRQAVDDVSFTIENGEILALLGPSGSGKSTLLRVIAGLTPSEGQVVLAGRDITTVPTHRRGVGLMFQDHALFPHLDVGGNVAFGLSGAGKQERVDELLELVGLAGAAKRKINTLSGGEQQRVALARALAPEPKLLMLDEPLGQLDRQLRDRLVIELRELFKRLGTTVLAVTHDHDEAFALADRAAIMSRGKLLQSGTADQLKAAPVDEFVADFLGATASVRRWPQ
ncbi:MAG: ABC transporter ATP-binding protein [Corynebacteriales bacterium]|nr:ABC transporter ATP-binding protein [Mycobacteriales bacterium]